MPGGTTGSPHNNPRKIARQRLHGIVVFRGAKFYMKRATQSHVILRCINTQCNATAKVPFISDGIPTPVKLGGKLPPQYIDLIVASKEHTVHCNGHSLRCCPSYNFLQLLVEKIYKNKQNKLITDDTMYPNLFYYLRCRNKMRERVVKTISGKPTTIKERWIPQKGVDAFRSDGHVLIPNFMTRRDSNRFDFDKLNRCQEAYRLMLSAETKLQIMAAKIDCPPDEEDSVSDSDNSNNASTVGVADCRSSLDMPRWIGNCDNKTSPLLRQCIRLETPLSSVLRRLTNYAVPHSRYPSKSHTTDGYIVIKTCERSNLFYNGTLNKTNQFIRVMNKRVCKFGGVYPQLEDGENENRYMAFLDTENILGNGSDMAYLRVGDYLDGCQIRKAQALSEYISPKEEPNKYLMFILMFSCGFVFNIGESRKQRKEMEDGWNKKPTKINETQMNDIVEALKGFVKDLRDTFVETEQFGTIGVNSLERVLWETWPELSKRYNGCRSDEEIERINTKFSSLGDEERLKSLCFHYFVIMAISAQSADESTRNWYNTLTDGVTLPKDFLLPLKEMELSEFIEVQIEVMRSSSLANSKLLPLIEIAIVASVFFDDDVSRMSTTELRAITQINWKKAAISSNIFRVSRGGEDVMKMFESVGGDRHVNRVIEVLAMQYGKIKAEDWSSVEANVQSYVLHHIGGECGYLVNELLGQTAQSHAQKDTKFVNAINSIMVDKNVEHGTTLSRWLDDKKAPKKKAPKKKAPKKKAPKNKAPKKGKTPSKKQENTPKRARGVIERKAKKKVNYHVSESPHASETDNSLP